MDAIVCTRRSNEAASPFKRRYGQFLAELLYEVIQIDATESPIERPKKTGNEIKTK